MNAKRLNVVISFLLLVALSAMGADTLVPTGAVWKYLDNGSDQGTGWRATSFNDSSWASGPAQLGYGDGDESTVVSFGPDAANKYITTYFRRSFNVADAAAYQSAVLRVLRDDGAVVYLNGTEIFRSNMPGGNVGYRTLASAAIDDTSFHQAGVNPALLVSGNNVLAVEIHQANGTSSDISFDLQLSASTTAQAPTVTRGPYLQLGTPTSIVVRWRTDIATDSRVRYGAAPGNLTSTADNSTVTTEHQVVLMGLTPDTQYYYSVGSTSMTFAGDDDTHFFVTYPPAGAAAPTRVWVLGDSGTADASAQAVRNAYFTATGSRHTDLWLMLGDNAYDSGTDSEYQNAVFNMYPTMLRKSVLLSTRGNHEADANAYYNIFTLPANGEAGGLASGSEAYYSFDFGSVHFICLDAFGSDRSANSPQANWLRNDLASTTREWIVAFWHHPPYSKGSHNSDSEIELVQMRENMVPILEDGGVDLVLSGHSHSYERSFLIDGHYDVSSTFSASHVVDGGSGRDATPYRKPEGLASHAGAVYTVAGSSGQISGGQLNHPAMCISLNVLGSVVLDFQTNRLDLSFLDSTGVVRDYFAILKSGAVPPPVAPEPPTNLAATSRAKKKINLTWSQSPSPAVTQNKIYRSTVSGGPYTLVATIPATTSYQNSGLTSGTTYYYVVTAVNSSNLESSVSNQASAVAR
jgi:acid phosphatase type 7